MIWIKSVKIGIVCSSGGHLTQALSALESFEGMDRFLVLQDFPSIRGIQLEEIPRIYRLRIFLNYSIWTGVVLSLFVNFFQLIHIFWKERPHLLFSTGAEIAIPAFFIGKFLFKTRLIFLESLARIRDLSSTGKILYHISDLFLVQWPELLEKAGPKAKYQGRLF
jgi:beta-1,4-N-acetylglucosaminyltransferase